MAEPDKAKMAAQCFRHANDALSKAINSSDYEYAIKLYLQACSHAPDNILFRQTLRGVERKKFGDDPKQVGRMAGMKMMASRGRIKKAQVQKDWPRVVEACEEALVHNPWDIGAQQALAAALDHCGWPEAAVAVYENILKYSDLNHVEVNRALAELYERFDQFNKAIACWERVSKALPHDEVARRKMTALAASRTIETGGYDMPGGVQSRAGLTDEQIRRRMEAAKPAADGPGADPVSDLQHRIRKDPKNVDLHLKLADLLVRNKDLRAAIQQLHKAREVAPDNPDLQERIEDLEIEQRRQEVLHAERDLAGASDGHAADQLQRLRAELNELELRMLNRRVERHPADLGLRYDLGTRLLKAGGEENVKAAIPHLQKARADSRRKAPALVALGNCFEAIRMYPQALRQYEEAAQDVAQLEESERAGLFYRIARIAEALKDREKAEKYYNEVILLDYSFKDAAERLEKLQSA